MSSSAGRRRLEKHAPRTARTLGRRAAEPTRGLLAKVPVSPAVVGALAVMVAAFGSTVTAGAGSASDDFARLGYETAASPYAKYHQAVESSVDVSRSFDRTTLAKQAASQVAQRARALKQRDQEIQARAEGLKEDAKRRKQWVLPVAGYALTARFGQRSGLWSRGVHTGLDFAGPAGTEIVAIAAGTVKSAGYAGSYGVRTVITLADGTEIWYCHQSKVTVTAGDQVEPGQLTGFTGATGNVTGPHLHLEIRPPGSGPIDPEPALRAHGIRP